MMKVLLKSLLMIVLINCYLIIQAQGIETTYNWGVFDHSCWKVQPTKQGYVMAGNKFFEPGNNTLYFQGFDSTGKSQFLKTFNPGFSSLDVLWKSFIASPGENLFTVTGGVQSSTRKAYALLIKENGTKVWDRISPLPNGIQFGGVSNAKNGGWIAVGGDNSGNLAAVRFDSNGNIKWVKTYPVSGFAWSATPAYGGGYYVAGTTRVIKISEDGTLAWSSPISLPASPTGAYTYTEFEEVMELPSIFGIPFGIIVTGSCFSNSHSGAYTAAFDVNGKLTWSTVHGEQNTALPGTPVSWISNAIIDVPLVVLTNFRTGPVSNGGTLNYVRQNFLNGDIITPVQSFGNTIPVQEAFIIKSPGKYIIGGTRGGYSAAYSFITKTGIPSFFDAFRRSDSETLPLAETNSNLVRINFNNTEPKYKIHSASRVFQSEFQVFPNPSTGLVNAGGKILPGSTLRVTDMMGRLVMEKQINIGDTQVELDLKNQGKGMYNVEMVSAGQIISKKVILQ